MGGNALTREQQTQTANCAGDRWKLWFYFFLQRREVIVQNSLTPFNTSKRHYKSSRHLITSISLKHSWVGDNLQCFVVTEERRVPTELMLVLGLTAVSWKKSDHNNQHVWSVGVLCTWCCCQYHRTKMSSVRELLICRSVLWHRSWRGHTHNQGGDLHN